jgi:hypothetical protein
MAGQQDIEPGRTALVAIDFQHDIVGTGGAFADLFHAEVERTNLIPAATRLLPITGLVASMAPTSTSSCAAPASTPLSSPGSPPTWQWKAPYEPVPTSATGPWWSPMLLDHIRDRP